MVRWLLFFGLILLVDFYAFQAVKTISKTVSVYWIYWLFSAVSLFYFSYSVYTFDRSQGMSISLMYSSALLILSFVPKLFVVSVNILEDLFRLINFVVAKFSSESNVVAGRRKFISQIAIGLAAIPFGAILYGVFKGRYNFKVVKHQLYFDDLPEAFDGYQLTHISDIHSGSFDNKEKIAYAIDLINEQHSDVILFTGDIVNNLANEMDPWIDEFKRLRASDGKFSVLGNHDYGEYIDWATREDKEANFQGVKDIHPKIGFDLLLNEHVYLEKGGEKVALIGVENWGTKFKKAGDLGKASAGVQNTDFKILMSHDPSHWETEVKDHPNNYHLTLSGHTHGMQFGIEIPGFKWSPVKYVYKYWAGIYKELGRYINVNRGFGFLAFPGRVGIWPEISVIELKKKRG